MFQKKAFVLAAMMATAAAAQAQVKLYGYMDLGVMSVRPLGVAAATKSTTAVTSGNLMTSFIGFSGSEDLGGGLKAEFTLESFVAADTGANGPNLAGGFWGRASNVALSGGFGKVILGQYDHVLFTEGLKYNPFGSSMTLSPTMKHYYGAGFGALSIDTGWVNSVTYETPNMNGLSATLQWAAKESNAVGAKDSAAASIGYDAGPFSAMLAYSDNGLAAPAYTGKQKVTAFGLSYDFGVLKAFGQYTNVNNSTTFNGGRDRRIYQLGASVPVSAQGTLMASYGESKEKTSNVKNKVFSLGYDHSLSKRTGVYAVYSTESQTRDVTSGRAFGVGVRHSF